MLTWVVLAFVVFDRREPTGGASPLTLLTLLAASALAASASVVLPVCLRRARVRATQLETFEEPDRSRPEGSYRRGPPIRRSVDADALRLAAVAVAAQGIVPGVVLAFAVSLGGLVLHLAGGPSELVALLFLGSWALMAFHAPDEPWAARALCRRARVSLDPAGVSAPYDGLSAVLLVLATAVVFMGSLSWQDSKAEADWAEALSARASPATATIDERRVEDAGSCDDYGCDERLVYFVAYHLTVAGARYEGTARQGLCYTRTERERAVPAMVDPADPRRNLLSCAAEELATRVPERTSLLVTGMGVSLLVLAGLTLARAQLARLRVRR